MNNVQINQDIGQIIISTDQVVPTNKTILDQMIYDCSMCKINYDRIPVNPVDPDTSLVCDNIDMIHNFSYLNKTYERIENQILCITSMYDNHKKYIDSSEIKAYSSVFNTVLKKLERKEFSDEDRIDYIERIAQVTAWSFARLQGEVEQFYLEFSLRIHPDAEYFILRKLQDYKDEIISEILEKGLGKSNYSNEVTAKTYLQDVLGNILGLDDPDKLKTKYKSEFHLSKHEVKFIRDVFYNKYSDIENLIKNCLVEFNAYAPEDLYLTYSELLKGIVSDYGIKDNIDEFVKENFFTKDSFQFKDNYDMTSKITRLALSLILKKIGIIHIPVPPIFHCRNKLFDINYNCI